jgi:hypothetical protein
MKKQLDIYKRLHGQNKHTCKRPGCTRMVLGDFCLEHLEAAIAGAWDEINKPARRRANYQKENSNEF